MALALAAPGATEADAEAADVEGGGAGAADVEGGGAGAADVEADAQLVADLDEEPELEERADEPQPRRPEPLGSIAGAVDGMRERQRARPPRADRAWYLPDHAKLQLAGDIGFLSPGIGWELAGRSVDLDLFFGWVPASLGGEDIYSATAKVAYAPLHVGAGTRWRLEPLRMSAQVTYTFGSQYFVTAPDRYPTGYYEVPTALHAGVALGGSASRRVGDGGEREIGFYWEAVALVNRLRDLWESPNVVDASDVVSFAFGTMLRF